MVTVEKPKSKRGRPAKNRSLVTDSAAAGEFAAPPGAGVVIEGSAEVVEEETPAAVAADGGFNFEVPYQAFGRGQLREFQRFTELYPDRRAITCYLWRLDPPIDRKQVGLDESNIQIIPGALDLDAVLERHGSGEYHVKFNDQNRKPAQRAKCTFAIEDPTKPPNVTPEELILSGKKGERNSALVAKLRGQGWSIVQKRNDLIPEGFQVLAPPPSPAEAASAGTALAQRGTDKELIGLIRELLASRGAGGSDIDRAFQIADRLKPAAVAPAIDPMLAKLIEKAVDRLLIPDATAAPPAAPDPFEAMEKMSGFFTRMGWVAPGAVAAGPSVSSGLAEFFTALPGILAQGAALIQQFAAFRMMQAGTPSALPALPAAPPLSPAPVPVASSALPPTSNIPAAAGQPIPGMDDPMKLTAMIEVGRLAMASIESGETGDDFAERICANPQLEPIYTSLCDMGRDGIVSILGGIPGLTEKLEPKRAALEVWLTRFLAYNEPAPDPPAAAPPAV